MEKRREQAYLKLNNIVVSKGGIIINYTNTNNYATFRCKDGHEWQALPGNIKAGTWCPNCSNCSIENFVQKFKEMVILKGGILLENYTNDNTKVTIQCNNGHTWRVSSN